MRIPENLLNELIQNEGELENGPINTMGVFRLALDLRDLRKEIEIWRKHAKVWRGLTDREISEWVAENR